MGSFSRPFFDLNEPPLEEEAAETNLIAPSQPQKSIPTPSSGVQDLLPSLEVSAKIQKNNAFTHASMGSGFQPFVRAKDDQNLQENPATMIDEQSSTPSLVSFGDNSATSAAPKVDHGTDAVEKEEGEWSDAEGVDLHDKNLDKHECATKGNVESPPDKYTSNVTDEVVIPEMRNSSGLCTENNQSSDCDAKSHPRLDVEVSQVAAKPKDVKGLEASHALRFANNPLKRPKLDEHKEAMLGKKRNRQTVFININEVKQKQASSLKTTTPRRQIFSSSVSTRTVKESSRGHPTSSKDQKQAELTSDNGHLDPQDSKVSSNGDLPLHRLKRASSNDPYAETDSASGIRHNSGKQLSDARQNKSQPILSKKPSILGQNTVEQKATNKKNPPMKKLNTNTSVISGFQDTSVERLLREVTNEKFWLHPEVAELQRVPGQFESVEDYIRVLEPLLLEECRAQLYSTWEESTEHTVVHVKNVERRERGWYDVILLPSHETKWMFKEGDAAVLSSSRPGSVRPKRNIRPGTSGDDVDSEINGRVAGTVRRHSPVDTRDPPGVILHFFVGDACDSYSKLDDDHILRKFQPRSVWCITMLGSLATTQREYLALHAFRRLNVQMQNAILKPSPEHFPKYEERPPAIPECFTQNFVEHLHRTFNEPQLAAIQWAAMHTAAGTNGAGKKQDPWPFTLVQGPPGTGKTHTVWGMLNVIHLVQYQHYYNALLKKLAPESYRQPNESSYEYSGTGSIDDVLHNMDQIRTLPKLCPKPRMLVCAPSNAATDELLARVLSRGFIDGEMKVYRPDAARVGVDSQNRAAQAVSVEQRTNSLLEKGREEVIGWLHSLRGHESQCSQRITFLQRQLTVAAAVGRSQGSVGVDPEVLAARDHNRDVLLQELAQAVEHRDKLLVEISRLLIVEGKFRAGHNFNIEDARAELEASFANEAEIVFTTVSSSGRKLFSRLTHGFDMIVIDEAAQASEVGVLPPLSLGAARCVLVGDPQQLPATVISKAAGTLLYSRSLFERFQQAGCPTLLLTLQYRMHPQIRDFPSRYFYQGRLTDSEGVSNLPDEIYYKDPLLQPYTFFDIMHGRESHRGGSVSYQNVHEAQFCLRLYQRLQSFLKNNGGNKVSVGIITPYKLQLRCIEREFEQVLKSEDGKDLYINTVDAFQGQERDVIIMSCVRASGHGVGFVADIRRMNVALTRAKRALWVVGNANALMQSEDWAALIADAKSRKRFMDSNSIPKELLLFKGPNHPCISKTAAANARGQRPFGPSKKSMDAISDPKPSLQSSDEDDRSSFPRNGSYRSLMKPQSESSSIEQCQTSEKSRDARPYGAPKRLNSGLFRRE